jgi:hypothetical protein
MYYLAAALGGFAGGLNALGCMVEDGRGFKGAGCTLRAEVLFRLAAGDAPGASILLWEVFQAGESAKPSDGVAHPTREGGELLLPHLPLACLAALPVPMDSSVEAQLNLYWMYQKRAKALLIDVYCTGSRSRRGMKPHEQQLVAQSSSSQSNVQQLQHTIQSRMRAPADGASAQNAAAPPQEALLREAGYYQREAACWLASSARLGSEHARRILAKSPMAKTHT